MATDIEEYESAILLVHIAYKNLRDINPDNPLLSLIELTENGGFKPTSNEHYEKYVKPHLKCLDGQLCLWNWAYPNQSEARMHGLLEYYHDLYAALKTEIVNRVRLVG